MLFALGENFSFLSFDPGYQRTIREARQSTAVELHLFQALFSLDPDNLQLHCFWCVKAHCFVVRSCSYGAGHPNVVCRGWGWR